MRDRSPANRVIGRRIRERREIAGMKQGELGRKLGVTGAAVSAWENGLNCISLVNAAKLAMVLNTTLDALLENIDGI